MSTTHLELRGTSGTVASADRPASGVGRSPHERGGNAVDAAVAAAFVLRVVEPHLVRTTRLERGLPPCAGVGPAAGSLRAAAHARGVQGCAVGR